MSGSEVTRLLEATTSFKYRAVFMLAYGAGLRVSELAALETTDIDSERMLIHVRTGKTGPRYVMLPPGKTQWSPAPVRALGKIRPGRANSRMDWRG